MTRLEELAIYAAAVLLAVGMVNWIFQEVLT